MTKTVQGIPPTQGVLGGVDVWVRHAEMFADPPERVEFSGSDEADPAWRYRDQASHKHAPETYTDAGGTDRVRSWPTLTQVVDETYWCEDCQEEHERSHMECPLCSETITPGRRAARAVVIPSPMQFRASLFSETFHPLANDVELTIETETYRGDVIRSEARSDGLVTYEFIGRPKTAGAT